MSVVNFIGTPISTQSAKNILGITENVPLSLEEMISKLRLTSFINEGVSPRLLEFTDKLVDSFKDIGVDFTPRENCLNEKGKIKEDTTILYPIAEGAEDIAIDHVSSLYRNPIVGIFDEPAPIDDHSSNQERLDTIISYLTKEIIHIAVFVNHDSFTVCTMNGAVIQYPLDVNLKTAIRESLISKLTAQVVPPEVLSDIEHRQGHFDSSDESLKPIINDIQSAASRLKENGLLMSHLKVDSIDFRSQFHKRIASSYLDERSGMSYGFLVWQMPSEIPEAREVIGPYEHGDLDVSVWVGTKQYVIKMPEVWVICTRSGCDKTNINVATDIVRIGWVGGKIIFDTPKGIDKKADCKPSYDTLTILSHGIGNVINASLIRAIKGDNEFVEGLETRGLSLFHWHGYPLQRQIPFGFFFHGQNNPSVSCSTAQSAIYTLWGKIDALKHSFSTEVDYKGDVHIEPHHGSNISSSLRLSEVITYILTHY